MCRRVERRHGFTLLEVLLASSILAMTAVALSQVFLAGQMQSRAALHRQRATDLAESLMEEILALPYIDPDADTTPGPDTGEAGRADFDACDDFHGFSESAGSIADAQGAALPAAYQMFSRSATAAYGSQTVTGFSAAVPGLSVTVTVQDAQGESWTLTRFIVEP